MFQWSHTHTVVQISRAVILVCVSALTQLVHPMSNKISKYPRLLRNNIQALVSLPDTQMFNV